MRRRISTFLLLVLTAAGLLAHPGLIGIPPVRAVTWSTGISLTPTGSIEDKPYVIQDSQANLWVAYESSRTGNWDIFIRTYNGISWQPEQQATNNTASDLTPALVQLANGNVMLVWSSNRAGNFSLYYKTNNAGVWSGDTRLTSPQGRDSTPSLLQLRNGTLWLLWTREALSGGSVVRYIYSKTYSNGVWSPEARFTSGGSEEEPSLFQTDDGNIWVMYAANRFGNLDIFYKIFNGVWSSEFRLTSNSDDDHQSWLTQDLNGVLWEFWTRCVSTGQTCEDDVFYEASTNLGATWSAEVQFTVDPTGYTIYDSHPAAVHYSRDKMLYVFWGTDLTGPGADYDVWLRTSNPILIHDVSLSNANSGPKSLQEAGLVKVNVTANNPGSYNETLTINGYYQNATSILFKTMSTTLMPGRSAFIQMSWDTIRVVPANYQVLLLLQPVPGESTRRLADNTAVAGNATVLPIPQDIDRNGRVDVLDLVSVALKFGATTGPADVNRDCTVNIRDLVLVALAFLTKPGDPKWNPLADVNGDGRVDILDLARVGLHFGLTMGRQDINLDCTVNILDLVLVAIVFGFGT